MSPKHLKGVIWLALALITLTASLPAATLYWNKDTTQGVQWTYGPNWAVNAQGGSASSLEPQATDSVRINQYSSAADPVIFNSGTSKTIKSFTMGDGASDAGYLEVKKGGIIFESGSTFIGKSGTGELTLTGSWWVEKQAGAFILGNAAGSDGTIVMEDTSRLFLRNTNSNLDIGKYGDGYVYVDEGAKIFFETNNKAINIGVFDGTGILQMYGGLITADNATSTQSLKVGYNGGSGSGNGYLQGYGEIELLNPTTNTGNFMVGGAVIGDGTGADASVSNRTLDIQSYKFLTTDGNTPGSTFFGYFTSNQGAISLPDIVLNSGESHVFWGDDQTNAGRYTIGDSLANGSNVLLNSAYLHRSDTSTGLTLDISLLDPTRTQTANETASLLANTTGKDFLNIWQVDVSGGALEMDKFAVRYDETTETNGAGNFDSLGGFYYWDGTSGTWTDLTGDSTVDTANYLANLNSLLTITNGGSGFFALAAGGGSMSPFGICSSGEGFGQYANWIPLLADINVVGVRGFPGWNNVEPSNDNWNWTLADAYMNTAEANGIEVNGVFSFSAAWAAPSQKHFPMSNLPEWEEYITEVTNRYAGRVKYWEVWNEPNAGSFNAGNNSAYDYATLLRLAYAAAKAEDPDCLVGISIANFHIDYIRGVIDALEDQGAAGSFDFIAVHPYELTGKMNEADGEMYYLNAVPALRQMLAVHAPTKVDIPIWFTELGAHIGGNSQGETVDEDLVAELLIKAYVLGIAQGVERIEWFSVKDAGGSQNYGIMDDDYSIRKAHTAYDALTDTLGTNPKYQGWLTPDSNGWGYGIVFTDGANTNMAAWMPKGESASVSFGTNVEIVNIKTNTTTTASSMTLTDVPVLIKGVPAGMLATAQANKSQPFPWGSTPVNSNLAQIELGATTIEQGVEIDRAFTVVANGSGTNGVVVNQVGGNLFLSVVPSFMDYNSDTFYVRVTCHQEELRTSGYSGMNLFYQNNNGDETAAPAYPYKNRAQWRGLQNNLNTQTFTWTVNNAMMVHTFGYSFYLKFDASVPFVIDKVEISKTPF